MSGVHTIEGRGGLQVLYWDRADLCTNTRATIEYLTYVIFTSFFSCYFQLKVKATFWIKKSFNAKLEFQSVKTTQITLSFEQLKFNEVHKKDDKNFGNYSKNIYLIR